MNPNTTPTDSQVSSWLNSIQDSRQPQRENQTLDNPKCKANEQLETAKNAHESQSPKHQRTLPGNSKAKGSNIRAEKLESLSARIIWKKDHRDITMKTIEALSGCLDGLIERVKHEEGGKDGSTGLQEWIVDLSGQIESMKGGLEVEEKEIRVLERAFTVALNGCVSSCD